MGIKKAFIFLLTSIYIALSAAEVPENIKLATEQVLRIDLAFKPENVHPHYSRTLYEKWILKDLFEGLVSSDANGQLVPGAALRWEVSQDYMVWTFLLRPEGRWSNGDLVTAEDFVYSVRTLLMSDSRNASNVDSLWRIHNAGAVKKKVLPLEALGIRAIDTHTLEIRLEAPDPFFPQRFGCIYPLHKDSSTAWDTSSDIATSKLNVTNGAYCNLVYITNLKYQANRNPYYWDNAKTVIDQVEYYFTEDVAIRQERFQKGQMDLSLLISHSSGVAEQYVAKFGDCFKPIPSAVETSVVLNVEKKPFNNVKVRQAFNMVIDRERMLKCLKQENHLPIYSELHPSAVSQPLIEPEWVKWPYEKRVAEARTKLKGLKLPPITLICSSVMAKTNLPAYLAKLWKETLGAEVRVLEMDFQIISQKRRNKDFMMQIRGATHDNVSFPWSFLELFIQPAKENYCNYYDPRLVTLLEEALCPSLTAEQRESALLRANCLLAEEGPVLSLCYRSMDYLVQPSVGGISANHLEGCFRAKDLYLVDES